VLSQITEVHEDVINFVLRNAAALVLNRKFEFYAFCRFFLLGIINKTFKNVIFAALVPIDLRVRVFNKNFLFFLNDVSARLIDR
jgi:hypothetical protein